MKKTIILGILMMFFSCTNDTALEPFDKAQKSVSVTVKGYSSPDVIQMRLNGKPVSISGQSSYKEKVETVIDFVADEGENNELGIYNFTTGKSIAQYNINYHNFNDFKELNFFNLPDIFLQTYAVKPQVNLGKVGFVFIFPNLGEFSGSSLEGVKGILKRENGVVLAEFDNIGKKDFTSVKIYNFFSTTAPVFLELYKPGTTEPYSGSSMIKVTIKQDIGANMIVLQEVQQNGSWTVKGDIDVADYL